MVAIAGTSTGWSSALAHAGALTANGGLQVVNTKRTLMQARRTGEGTVNPFVDDASATVAEAGRRDLPRVLCLASPTCHPSTA